MQSVKAISIHAPCTGSDYVEPSGLAVHTNFNPRSPHGERPAGSPPAMVSASYFNPRSPHGERHSSAPANTSPPGISIHAPRTGSDYTALLPPSSQWISIHAPRTGSDVCDSVLNSVDSLFQSTLPARGATFGILRCVADLKSFQSTLPARGATAGAGIFQPARIFQSTLPARGATARDAGLDTGIIISIHAPRTGSDDEEKLLLLELLHFNPRSPHGERHHRRADCPIRFDFNPRSPHGERRCRIPGIPCRALFQSTLPARGATWYNIIVRGWCVISIHAPRTGSDDVDGAVDVVHLAISIHAPRTGSDLRRNFLHRLVQRISIHAPRTGSDPSPSGRLSRRMSISIHAPRTGSDLVACYTDIERELFQSTLPARGATYQRPSSLRTSGYFNPRSPHGERRAPATSGRPREPFQSTLPARGATGCSPGQMPGLIFQSTLPARGATRQRRRNDGGKQGFQSTLPARGATRGQQSAGLLVHYFNPRSPHGERPLQCFRLGQGRHFNPRSPHGERRFSRFLPRFAVIISIHAPRTGSDHPALRRASESLPISIHAPRTGSDDGSRRHFEKRGNFNPRSPHGERRADVKLTLKQCSFQSTLPARGATLELLKTAVYQSFQSTLPARGATLIRWVCCRGFFHFNPRSPHGERLRRVRLPCAGRAYFNPRSPHGERRCWKGTPENRNYFNPRSPHGERRIC